MSQSTINVLQLLTCQVLHARGHQIPVIALVFGTNLSQTGLPYNFCPLIHAEQLKQCREIADPLANRVVFQTSAH